MRPGRRETTRRLGTLPNDIAVKARGLTKEQIIAHLRAVAENNLRADIRTIERAWKETWRNFETSQRRYWRESFCIVSDVAEAA